MDMQLYNLPPWQNIAAISLPLTLHELGKGQLHALKLLMWHLVNI